MTYPPRGSSSVVHSHRGRDAAEPQPPAGYRSPSGSAAGMMSSLHTTAAAYADAVSEYAALGRDELRGRPALSWRLLRVAVELGGRPEVAEHGETQAPDDREPPVVADVAAEQQPPQRLDGGRERLVLGDRLEPARHRVDRDEGAGEERQEDQR